DLAGFVDDEPAEGLAVLELLHGAIEDASCDDFAEEEGRGLRFLGGLRLFGGVVLPGPLGGLRGHWPISLCVLETITPRKKPRRTPGRACELIGFTTDAIKTQESLFCQLFALSRP